jgi:hypothetical protein
MSSSIRPDVEATLAAAVCPGCGGPTVETSLQQEDAAGARYAATCSGCSMEFEVRVGEPPEAVVPLLELLVCPACGAGDAEFELVCELPGLICGLQVSCSSCGERYVRDAV